MTQPLNNRLVMECERSRDSAVNVWVRLVRIENGMRHLIHDWMQMTRKDLRTHSIVVGDEHGAADIVWVTT